MKRAILLLVDGLRADVAEAELQAGRLPNLAKLTTSGGRSRAATVFPSTTSVAYLPFLTGCLPGRCNVPSIRWLDREQYRGRWWRDRQAVRSYCGYQAGYLDADIAPDVQTIFDLVPDSVALYSMVTRGLPPAADPLKRSRTFWGTVSHYSANHQPGDDAVGRELIRQVDRDWRFLFAQFPAVDGHTHAATPEAPRVLQSLRQVDRIVGQLLAALERRGIGHDTLIMLVSDHGSAVVDHHLDVAEWFRGHGVATLAHPELWTREPQVAVMVAGNAAAAVYAKPNLSRAGRLSMDQLRQPGALGAPRDMVAALAAERGVALIAAENGQGGVRVLGGEGEADLNIDRGVISYRRTSGDPLQVGDDVAADDKEWLARTVDGPYPDAPLALLDQFRAARTGDLVLAAREGWDFRRKWEYPEHKSGHGSLIAAHMITPLWSNQPLGPGPWRTADVFPQLLAWLGIAVPSAIDGSHSGAPSDR